MSSAPQWIQAVEVALIDANRWQRNDDRWQILLPYCLLETDSDDVRCVVNRKYKLVGHVKTDVFEILLKMAAVDERGFLFTDASAPWRSRESFKQYANGIEQLLLIARLP